MTAPVLVAGGTGRLGRHVVGRLRSADRDVRVLSRRGREKADSVQFFVGDLATGEGVDTAVAGVAAIAHCASSTKGDAEATRSLVRAASGAAQFYDYLRSGAQKLAWLPVVPVPAGFRIRLVDADEVAARLVDPALGGPAGRVPDMAGPQVTNWVDLQRDYLRASHRHR